MTFPATVTVCAECLTANCWHGNSMCDKARNADVVPMTVKQLLALNLEHPSYWTTEYYQDKVLGVKGVVYPDLTGCCSWCLQTVNEDTELFPRDTNGKLYCRECARKHGDW